MKPSRKAVKPSGPTIAQSAPAPDSPCGSLKSILPIRDALDLLSGKWKIPIMGSLFSGPKRFKTLQRDVKGITAKMLSKELKDLEMNDLVVRTVYDTAPVRVEYAITRYGSSLEKVVRELHDWGSQHRKRIVAKVRGQQEPPPLRLVANKR